MCMKKTQTIRNLIIKYLEKTPGELTRILDDPQTPLTESETIAIQLVQRIADDPIRNFTVLKFIIEQLEGKAIERKDMTVHANKTPSVRLQFVQNTLDDTSETE